MSNNPYNFIWVGLERESDGDWKWDDGTSLNYTNWKRNHPKGSLHLDIPVGFVKDLTHVFGEW